MDAPRAYIAGVGVSQAKDGTSDAALHDLVISAGTKALLDAGVTYGDVKQSITCYLGQELRVPRRSFDTYGKTGTPALQVECYSGIHTASRFAQSGHANCVLMIGFDKSQSQGKQNEGEVAAVGIVLVSQKFFRSHSYLKDSAVSIRGLQVASPVYSRASKANGESLTAKIAIQAALRQAVLASEDIQIVELQHGSNPSIQEALGELRVSEDNSASPVSHPYSGTTGLAGLCELVWQLRGWTQDRSVPKARNCLQYTTGPDGSSYVTIISRADGQAAPKWEKIKHLRDGRERLGYNPAVETKDISFEDWQAVKAPENFVPESTEKILKLLVKGGDRAALARL